MAIKGPALPVEEGSSVSGRNVRPIEARALAIDRGARAVKRSAWARDVSASAPEELASDNRVVTSSNGGSTQQTATRLNQARLRSY